MKEAYVIVVFREGMVYAQLEISYDRRDDSSKLHVSKLHEVNTIECKTERKSLTCSPIHR